MSSVTRWARLASSERSERELIIEMEHLLLCDYPAVRSAVSTAAATAASQIASRQGLVPGTPANTMWRADRSPAAFSAFFAFGVLQLVLNVAVIALPIALAIKPVAPFTDVVMIVSLCALLALPLGWLGEVFRLKAALVNVSPTALFNSYAVLNTASVAFILAYSSTLTPAVGVASWPLWPLAIAAAALGNALLARLGRNNQRALQEDLALHRADQDLIWDSRRQPIDRIVGSALKRCRAALATLSPHECEELIATRSAALDVLVSRNVFSPSLADALRSALPGTALITFASVRVELGIE